MFFWPVQFFILRGIYHSTTNFTLVSGRHLESTRSCFPHIHSHLVYPLYFLFTRIVVNQSDSNFSWVWVVILARLWTLIRLCSLAHNWQSCQRQVLYTLERIWCCEKQENFRGHILIIKGQIFPLVSRLPLKCVSFSTYKNNILTWIINLNL